MPLGPVDVYIIGFPGNKFSGEIVPAILEQVEKGVIRIVDLLFVGEDESGHGSVSFVVDLISIEGEQCLRRLPRPVRFLAQGGEGGGTR